LNCGALPSTHFFVVPPKTPIASRDFSHSGSGKAPGSFTGVSNTGPVAAGRAHQETRLKSTSRTTTLLPSSHYSVCSTLSSSVFRRSLCPLPPSISFLDPTAEVDGQSACIWIGVQSRVVFSFFQRFLSNFELSPIIACRTGYDLELPNPRHLSTVHPPTPSPHHIVPI
jgi:hypothetical protein